MGARIKRWILPLFLVTCVALVGFWETMAHVSSGQREAFELTGEDFRGFRPRRDEWMVRMTVTTSDDDTAPTILAYALTAEGRPWVIARLVHGYNMPDCMRLKQHDVALLSETRDPRCQIWSLYARDTEDASIWITSMIRAYDFSGTDMDTRSMPFPRIASVDDPNWAPNGITREGLQHPVRNLTRFFKHRWSSSRNDLATFLRLKKPSWGSSEVLILVVHGFVPDKIALKLPETERREITRRAVLDAHDFMLAELRDWRGKKGS